jgi:hypothetical protein
MEMDHITAASQWFNLAASIAILAVMVRLWLRLPDFRFLYIAPALWAVYGLGFYILLLSGHLDNDAVLMLGAVHRSLAYILIFGGAWMLLDILTETDEENEEDDERVDPYDG